MSVEDLLRVRRGRGFRSARRRAAGGAASARARAIATRCCSPPESWSGKWLARSVRPTAASSSSARARAAPGRPPADPQRQRHVVARVELVEQVVVLEHEADQTVADPGPVPRGEPADRVDPSSSRQAGLGPVEEADQVEQGALAHPRRPDHRQQLAPPRPSRSRPRSTSTRVGADAVALGDAPQPHHRPLTHSAGPRAGSRRATSRAGSQEARGGQDQRPARTTSATAAGRRGTAPTATMNTPRGSGSARVRSRTTAIATPSTAPSSAPLARRCRARRAGTAGAARPAAARGRRARRGRVRFSAAIMATLHSRLRAATTSIRPTATKIITRSRASARSSGRCSSSRSSTSRPAASLAEGAAHPAGQVPGVAGISQLDRLDHRLAPQQALRVVERQHRPCRTRCRLGGPDLLDLQTAFAPAAGPSGSGGGAARSPPPRRRPRRRAWPPAPGRPRPRPRQTGPPRMPERHRRGRDEPGARDDARPAPHCAQRRLQDRGQPLRLLEPAARRWRDPHVGRSDHQLVADSPTGTPRAAPG